MRRAVVLVSFWFCGVLWGACHGGRPGAPTGPLPSPDAQLVFVGGAEAGERTLGKREIAQGPLEVITGFDPYYQRDKRYWAAPLAPLLARGLPGVALEGAVLVLHADDGYAVPIEGARLLDGTAYLALGDADHPTGWDPIGPQRADPGGFYLVWKGPDRTDLVRYPRPWRLTRIERTTLAALYPHTIPTGFLPGTPTMAGYKLFLDECVHCHAVNREGGRVGPELNVPQSIVDYRPVEQIRAYIRNPQTFRYSAMPAHPQMSEGDLDALVDYLVAMSRRKHDPEAHR